MKKICINSYLCPSLENDIPLTYCLCALIEKIDLLSDTSHALISPSNVPETIFTRLEGHLLMTETESECPESAPKKGFANILSNFVATSAR